MECMETCICENVALENAWKILTASKQRTFVAVQISPAVRVAIGEKFGLSRGEDAAGKIVSALELLGADVVVDTAVAFDAITLIRSKDRLNLACLQRVLFCGIKTIHIHENSRYGV